MYNRGDMTSRYIGERCIREEDMDVSARGQNVSKRRMYKVIEIMIN